MDEANLNLCKYTPMLLLMLWRTEEIMEGRRAIKEGEEGQVWRRMSIDLEKIYMGGKWATGIVVVYNSTSNN